MKQPNAVKQIKRQKTGFHRGDFIKHQGKYWYATMRDKEQTCFALATKHKDYGKINYRKLFIVATDISLNGNFKFEFV